MWNFHTSEQLLTTCETAFFLINDIDPRTCQRPNNQPKLGRLRELNWYLKHIDCPNAKIFKYGKIERDFFFCSRQFFLCLGNLCAKRKKNRWRNKLDFQVSWRSSEKIAHENRHRLRALGIGEREKENCCSGLGKASGNPIQWVLRREGSLKQPPARYS